jgi:creatinine amidohydrolase
MKLAELTYPQSKTLLEAGAIALWPTGSTEAHGPHLPLNTDVIISEETCLRAVRSIEDKTGLKVIVLPPLSFTVTEFAAPFSGTLNIPKATTVAYVRDVLLATAAQGFRAVCVVNAHLEPQHRFALRDAIKVASKSTDCPLGLADPADARFAASLTEEFASGSCHAGQYETSLIMAARPDLIDDDAQRDLADHPIELITQIKSGAKNFLEAGADNAYCGFPAQASIKEGEESYARLTEIVEEIVIELLATEGPS